MVEKQLASLLKPFSQISFLVTKSRNGLNVMVVQPVTESLYHRF